MARPTRTRRKRRQFRQALRHGSAAKPSHRSKGGRTGQVQAKKLRSRRPKDKAGA